MFRGWVSCWMRFGFTLCVFYVSCVSHVGSSQKRWLLRWIERWPWSWSVFVREDECVINDLRLFLTCISVVSSVWWVAFLCDIGTQAPLASMSSFSRGSEPSTRPGTTSQEMREEREYGGSHRGSWGAQPGRSIPNFHLHSSGKNPVFWPHLPSREARKANCLVPKRKKKRVEWTQSTVCVIWGKGTGKHEMS